MTLQLGSARASLCTEPIALSSDGVSLKDVNSPRAHQPVRVKCAQSKLESTMSTPIAQTASFQTSTIFGMPEIGNSAKTIGFVDMSNAYIPSVMAGFVHRREFLREVLAFLNSPDGDALFVTGPTGSGKTSGILQILGTLNWPTQQVTGNGKMELCDLVGHHALVSEKPGETPSMKFMYGPLAIAMREGHALLINEVDLIDPAELAGLNDVLEGRPLVIGMNGGEIIKAHRMFRVIVTGNSRGAGDVSGQYQGVQMQNLAAMDRYRFTVVSYPEKAVEEAIVTKASPKLPKQIVEGMVRLADDVRKLFMGSDGQGGQLAITFSTRTLVRWAKLSTKFKGAPNPLGYALDLALLNRATPEDATAITRLAKDIFGEQWKDDTPATQP